VDANTEEMTEREQAGRVASVKVNQLRNDFIVYATEKEIKDRLQERLGAS
jgi:hypothetical protein